MKNFLCVSLRLPNGGLFIARHIEICNKIIQLEEQAFSPNFIHREPSIHLGRSLSEEDLRHGSESPRNTGWCVKWESYTEAMIDVRFRDAGAETWKPVRMDKLLEGWEKTNKDKHGQAWYNQRRHFSLFVLLVNGMMGKEALVILATLSQLMAAKMDKPISQIIDLVNVRISIVDMSS